METQFVFTCELTCMLCVQMEVEKDVETQFAEVQAALNTLPHPRGATEDNLKIHEMSQVSTSLTSITLD